MLCCTTAFAQEYSDTSLGLRYGTRYREPFNPQYISKNIVSLTHASGYGYGSNFLNADLLFSDSKDPSSAKATSGASEIYLVYRHTLDLGKLSGHELKFGGMRGLGISGGFDYNAKRDAGYNSRKRMLVLGPTLMLEVPGFLNLSLLALWESNHPGVSAGAFDPGYPSRRYRFSTHPMLNASWAIPVAQWSFEGYANFIGTKGPDETGHPTAPETNIDMQLMYDLSGVLGSAKHALRAGLEYQYWHNKFGNSNRTTSPSGGNTASTPMLRLEYHF